MGNCFVKQENIIKVVKTDGKVLEYKAPIKAHQVLSDFPGHAISDTLPAARWLRPDDPLIGGHVYYLLPLQGPPDAVDKKRVRFASPEREDGGGSTGGVVRIKVVMSKKELEVMLRKGGISLCDLVSHVENKESTDQNEEFGGEENIGRCEGWKPVLKSIPEVN
ncbi:uncharacterized protein LOC130788910 [Actinidia eriantha]|uniref:uncharacterized protein LOC130788910 n=1 Tax=Actinidia eriantha TaxID=165200 RepID=UPI00258E492B|nr:uncharacterized protein LOC130788910 [Actinidia eriantha]